MNRFRHLNNNIIKFIEVGPRDGLQNEMKTLSSDQRASFIKNLLNSGLKNIEVGSFVNYSKVPQMKDTNNVLTLLKDTKQKHDAEFSVLVPSLKELHNINENFFNDDIIDEIVFFLSASNTFNKRNINTDIDGGIQRYQVMVDYLNQIKNKPKIRGSISCVWGCPYEQSTKLDNIMTIIEKYNNLQVDTIDICDTIGVATPETVHNIITHIKKHFDINMFSMHMHDTNGMAVNNLKVGIDMGIKSIQGSIGGIGGCPFSSKRVGNVDTISVLKMLSKYDIIIDSNINIEKLIHTKQELLMMLK